MAEVPSATSISTCSTTKSHVRLCNYVDVYKNDRITRAIDFMEASAEAREITKFQIQRGDVLSTKDSDTPDDIAISAWLTIDLPGCSVRVPAWR